MSAGSRSLRSWPFGRSFQRQFAKFFRLFAGIALGSLAGLPAVASPALVQHASKDAGTTLSSSLAFPANNTAGNWIGVVIRAGHSGQVLTVSDSRGNTYRQAVQFNQTLDAPNGETLAIYYAENIAGGTNTVTVSESISNNTLRFSILEYSGVATANSLDATAAAQGTGTALNSGNATTTANGDLVLGAVATADGVTYTAGSGYAIEERVPAAPNTKLIAEDEIQAVASVVSVSATLSVSDNGGALMAAFKAASGVLTPGITSLSPTSGPVGTSVTISGGNWGLPQGTSTVTFNGVAAIPTTWNAGSIVAPVPTGASTGNVVVTFGGVASNSVVFIVSPVITKVTPSIGPVGSSISISGTNFGSTQGNSVVQFITGGSGSFGTTTSWSDTSITVVVPSGATTGTVQVLVGYANALYGSNQVPFTVSPNITGLSPTTGSVGTAVTITGTTFGGGKGTSTVAFNGTLATQFFGWSDTQIATSVPTGATSGNVVVTVGGVASNSAPMTIVTDTTPPTAPTNLTATAISAGEIDLSWTASTDNVGVSAYLVERCQGAGCATFTQIQSIPPVSTSMFDLSVVPSSSYTYRVRATDAAGNLSNYSNIASATTQSIAITSLSPTSGVAGAPVTITGTNFGATQGTSAVAFNGIAATPTSWSATSIIVPVPAGATTGYVVVSVGGVPSNSVQFLVIPNITNLSPASGAWGTSVTITGTGFGQQGSGTVTFNGTSANPTSWSATSILVPVPSGATNGNVVVTVGGAVSNGVNFTVTGPPTIMSLSPVLGTAGTMVTIAGANFGASQGTSTVAFNGIAAAPTSWSATSIVVPVPAGATTGNVVVTVGGQASNAANFTVQPTTVPIALVQHRSIDAGTTNSATLAFSANNTAGNFIAVAIRAGHSGQVFTITDSRGNTYHPAIQFNVTLDTPNGDTLGIFYAENVAGGANAVSVSDSIASSTMRLAILEYSGVAKSNSLDISTAAQGTGTTANSGSVPTTASGDLLFGAILTSDPANFTAGTGYTLRDAVPALPNAKLITEDGIQSTAGSVAASASLSVSVKWGAGLAAFKPAAGSGSSSPTITSLNPTSGMVGAAVTITGMNFGAAQGSSTVAFNSAAANPTNWTTTSIAVPVPAGATTGNVVVIVGGVASNGVTFTVIQPPPSISSLNPSSAIAGGGSFTLSVAGTNFVPASVVQWNGSARTTAFISSTQLQATITSTDIAAIGTAKVTVANPGFGGGISPASAFFVGATGGSNFAVISVNQAAQDIVYDPKNQVIYVSVPGTASSNPNTISVLEPTTGTITSAQPAGNNPNVLAISDDSQFLYAGIDGAASVQRFILPGLAPDISYPLGTNPNFGPYFALDLQVAPGAPHTTAVSLGNSGVSPKAEGGITIFDDATARPTKVSGFGGTGNLFDSLQWGTDATTLLAANNETTIFDFYTLTVNASGVSLNQDFTDVFTRFADGIHYDAGTKLIYSDEGHVINPTTGLPVGNFNALGDMVVDAPLNTAFFISGGSGSPATIESFDLTHFTPISSITISNVAGSALHLIRWGQNGLAFIDGGFNGSSQVFLIGGDFVSPAPPFTLTPPPTSTPPPTPAANAPTIASLNPSSAIAGSAAFTLTVSGTQFDQAATVQFNGSALATTFVSSTQMQATIPAGDVANPGSASVTVANPIVNGGTSAPATFFVGTTGGTSSVGTGFAVEIVSQASKDIVFDPVDQLFYLSVPNTGTKGNIMAVLDPATTQIVGAQYAGSNPNIVAISDDGQFLYAGIDGSSSVQRFTLPGLQRDVSYSLGALGFSGPLFALDLQVAPGRPHTTAVSSGVFGSTPAAQGGIIIFDDATARPTTAKGFGPGGGGAVLYDSLQWRSDTTALFAANDEDTGFDFYTLSVTSSGVVLANDYPNTFSSFRNRIHFDSGTKLIYADDGHVIDPATGLSAGTFAAFGVMVPDSTLNRAFFVTAGAGSTFTIQAFDLTHFTAISTITLSNVSGQPLRLIRWGQNGLAFNTDAGQIVLVGGNFVH